MIEANFFDGIIKKLEAETRDLNMVGAAQALALIGIFEQQCEKMRLLKECNDLQQRGVQNAEEHTGLMKSVMNKAKNSLRLDDEHMLDVRKLPGWAQQQIADILHDAVKQEPAG